MVITFLRHGCADSGIHLIVDRFANRDLFMRYQFGMSVGHTYMHRNFPPPKIPVIPADFDYREMGKTPEEVTAEDTIDAVKALDGISDDIAHFEDMTDQEMQFYNDMYGS